MSSVGVELMTDATASPIPSNRVQTIMLGFIESNMNDDGVDRRGFSLRQIQALQAGAYRAEEHRDRFAQVLRLQHGRAC